MDQISRFIVWLCQKFNREQLEFINKELSDMLQGRKEFPVNPKDAFREKHPNYRDFHADLTPPLTEPAKKKSKIQTSKHCLKPIRPNTADRSSPSITAASPASPIKNIAPCATRRIRTCTTTTGKNAHNYFLCYTYREYLFQAADLVYPGPLKPLIDIRRIHNSQNILGLILSFYVSFAISARKTAFILQQVFKIIEHHAVIGLQNLDQESTTYRTFKQLIERLNRTFKFHVRPASGFKSDNGALSLIILFATHYNFLRPHISLDYKTPVEIPDLQNIETIQGKWIRILSMAS